MRLSLKLFPICIYLSIYLFIRSIFIYIYSKGEDHTAFVIKMKQRKELKSKRKAGREARSISSDRNQYKAGIFYLSIFYLLSFIHVMFWGVFAYLFWYLNTENISIYFIHISIYFIHTSIHYIHIYALLLRYFVSIDLSTHLLIHRPIYLSTYATI